MEPNRIITQTFRDKRRVRQLKNPKLRRIRYGLRTLLFLEYSERKRLLNLRLGEIRGDATLSFEGKRERIRSIIEEREDLNLFFHRSPINCWVCGNRMDDLIQEPDSLFWFCDRHIGD